MRGISLFNFIVAAMDKKPTNQEEVARKAAIARAIERTSDLYHGDAHWYFDHMWLDGFILERKYSSRRQAEYELAIARLGIAADLLRFDMRETMNYIRRLSFMLGYYPEDIPDMGLWTDWLPMASEVTRTPQGRNYFDMVLW